jgi:hypothetical protein
MNARTKEQLESLPQSAACRIIEFESAELRPGIIGKTYFLIVSGRKPWANMDVQLVPLIYVDQPDYWGIEVVGCLSGISLPVEVPYSVTLDVSHTLGKRGVEVIGASGRKQLDIPK